jgi:DNA-binding MarR family transcriptional regulator
MFGMRERKIENVVGAMALALSDSLHFGTQEKAPEPGPAASAITLLHHEPGLTIEQLRRALRLSHPGAVRLVDRLTKDGLVERRASAEDRRAVALHLTADGEASCTAILVARRASISCALECLDPEERTLLGQLAEKMLGSLIQTEDNAYQICRLCDRQSCKACPVDGALEAE